MKKQTVIASLILVLVFSSLACGSTTIFNGRQIKGSGQMVEKTFEVADFNEVMLSGLGNLIIEFGEEESLVIEAENNLMPYIEVDVRGNRLEIGLQDGVNLNPTRSIYYYLTVVDLSDLSISGLGDVEIASMDVEYFSLEVSGVGSVDIYELNATELEVTFSGLGEIDIHNGTVVEQTLTISGAGSYFAKNLESKNTTVTVSGIGSATVRASESLDATISGAGNVEYYGSPATQFSSSGIGDLSRLGD